jgi:hypothetical protein
MANLLTAGDSVSSQVSLRSAGNGGLIPATRIKLGNWAFSSCGPTAFNDLATEPMTFTNTHVLECKLETLLFPKKVCEVA